MIAKKQVSPEILEDEIYSTKGFPYLKVFAVALGMFCIGLLLNFSLQKNIEKQIVAALSANPNCPIQYEDLNVGLFLPKIGLSDAKVPGSCFQSRGSSLKLDSVNLTLSGLSFYPFGLKFDGIAFGDQIDFQSTLSLGLPSPMFKIHNSKMDMRIINTLAARPNLLKGSLLIEAQGKLEGANIQQMNMVLQAKNLSMPPQSINGLKIPSLNFGQAAGKLRISDQNQLNLDEFVLGNDNSPIVGKLNGQVRLNQSNINASQLDLTAHLKFAPEFIENFPILNFFLNNKEQTEDGFYRIQLTGQLGSPNVQ